MYIYVLYIASCVFYVIFGFCRYFSYNNLSPCSCDYSGAQNNDYVEFFHECQSCAFDQLGIGIVSNANEGDQCQVSGTCIDGVCHGKK